MLEERYSSLSWLLRFSGIEGICFEEESRADDHTLLTFHFEGLIPKRDDD